MSYILSMNEFKDLVKEHNENNEDYHLVIDETFNKLVYESFKDLPGVLMIPYVIDGKMLGVYYVCNLDMETFISKEIEVSREHVVELDKEVVLKLFETKLMNAHRVVYPRGFIEDLNYLVEKQFIDDYTFVGAFTYKCNACNRMTRTVNKYPVSRLFINEETGELLVIDSSGRDIKHVYSSRYIFEYRYETLVFNVLPNEPIMSITEIQKLYSTYLDRLESLYIQKYVENKKPGDFNRELKELLNSIIKLYNITKRFKVKAGLFEILKALENGRRIRSLGMGYNHIVRMLLEYSNYLKGLGLDKKVLNYIQRQLNCNDLVPVVKSEEVDLGTLAELRGFLYRLNKDRRDITTVLDTDLCKNKYAIANSSKGVIPYVVYLKEDNKLVMVYECLSELIASELTKPIIGNKVKLQWSDIRKIAIKSFENIDKCLFRPLVYKTYKYLHLAGKLKDEDLVTPGSSYLVRCMKDLFMLVPMNDIVWKNEQLYLKLPGFYRIRSIKYSIRYDANKGSYYTLVKYPMKSWEFVDTLISCLEYEYDFNNTPEFNTACNVLLNETLDAIRRNSKKVNTKVITLRKMYLDCVKYKLKNNLVAMVDNQNNLDKTESKLLNMMNQVGLK